MNVTEIPINGVYIVAAKNDDERYDVIIYEDETKAKIVSSFKGLETAQAALDLASWYTLGYQEGRAALYEQIKEILGVEA